MRPCTCHPDERPPVCQYRYALSDCWKSSERQEFYDTVNDWMAGHGAWANEDSLDKLFEALAGYPHSQGPNHG